MSAAKTLAWNREHRKDAPKLSAPLWLIWSNEHCGWWGPNECGYTPNRMAAGRYPFERALEICTRANEHLNAQFPKETMCPDWDTQPWGEEWKS